MAEILLVSRFTSKFCLGWCCVASLDCLAGEPCAISLQPSRLRITTPAKAILRSGGNVVQPSGMRPDNATLQNEITLRAVEALSCVERKKRWLTKEMMSGCRLLV